MIVFAAFALTIGVYVGCKDDDPPPVDPTPIASFQFTIDDVNFLTVSFTNFSQNATSYSWNFGDGNTSTQESPVHTYASSGTYTVELTATNSAGSATKSETITVMDPNEALTMLAGSTSKTWYLQREGIALGVGPGPNDNQWWSFGGVTPLGDRPCILDDQYTFHRDGTFEFNSNGTIFIDDKDCCGGWKEGEGCHDETEPDVWITHTGEDVSAFANGGDYTYDFDNANSTLTLNGLGAYIGLPNKTEEGDNFIPVSTKTYTIFNFAEGDVADSLQMGLVGAGQTWNFYLVSYHNPADLPDLPGTVPKADFNFVKDGFTVTFTNASNNSTSYMWDFGDGGMSTEENPVHTYASEGEYMVTLTARDDASNSDEITKTVIISAATFSAEVLSNADGKVWVLNGEGSYKVGPAPGAGDWWPGVDAQGVIDRACQMDDEFIFTDGGAMTYDAKGQVWAEAYMLGPDGCIEESELQAPYDVLGSGMHMFTVTEATDTEPARVTVIGEGAFIGFSKPYNGGELDGTIAPVSQITYDVLDYSKSGDTEILVLTIDYSADQSGGAWWTMTMRSVN
ncbi:MAG: PKD domain-containing protein [Saprospiraceae bacterium]|nr:PKD domain-containing protein [Saprospiraceae bacterium]